MRNIYKIKNVKSIVLLIIIPIICLFYKHIWSCTNTIYDNFETNNLRILHLVLYSDDKGYNKMYEITRKYYKGFPNVKTVYYRLSENIHTDYRLEDDILYIKGKESYVPGILEKTIKAFEYFADDLDNYDYIIRSNVSTIVNFDLFTQELIERPIEYGGKLENTPPLSQDVESVRFAAGIAIVLSRNAITKLLKNKSKVNYDIIDDVSIAIFFKENYPELMSPSIDPGLFYYVPNLHGDYSGINTDKIIAYRNKNFFNRELDVIQMDNIVNAISGR